MCCNNSYSNHIICEQALGLFISLKPKHHISTRKSYIFFLRSFGLLVRSYVVRIRCCDLLVTHFQHTYRTVYKTKRIVVFCRNVCPNIYEYIYYNCRKNWIIIYGKQTTFINMKADVEQNERKKLKIPRLSFYSNEIAYFVVVPKCTLLHVYACNQTRCIY